MILISKDVLLPVLDRCSKITSQKSTTVQLGHVRLELDTAGKLEYQATNLTTSIRGTCLATGKPIKFTVNARDLHSYAKAVVGTEVKLSLTDKGKLKVSGEGRRAFTCDTLSADDFPDVPTTEEAFVDLPGSSVRQLIERASFAMGENDDRDGLKSIRLRVQDGFLSAAAANGRVLGFAKDALDSEATMTAIVSRGGIGSLLGTETDKIGLCCTDRFIYFRHGEETIMVKTLAEEGSFPPIEAVVDQCMSNRTNTALINAPLLVESLQAIKRADSKSTIDITFLEGELKLEIGHENESGYAVDSIASQGTDTGQVRMNTDYLIAALRGSENVTLGFGEYPEAFTITDGMYTAIVMPMDRKK